MTHQYTITEPTQALRDWHRTDARLTTEVAQRIYAGGLPKTPTFPAIVLTRQGGSLDGVIDNGLYRYDVWADTASESARIAGVLVSALLSTGPTDMAAGLFFVGATPNSPAYFPDPAASGIHRHTFVTQVTTRQNL